MKQLIALAALVTASMFAAGCAVDSASNEEGSDPGTAGELGTAQQPLLACANDVFSELTWNVPNDGASTAWTNGCVSHRVELGLLDMDHPVYQQAVADFPQYEGTLTAAKFEACQSSYIEVWTGEKANASTSSYSNLGYWKLMAVPVLKGNPLRIESCRATWSRGGGCTWNPPSNYDYTRVDVRGVPNGNVANSAASKVYQSTKKYVDCGSL